MTFKAISLLYPKNLNLYPPWNIIFENGWLEDEISFHILAYFQGSFVSFRERI